jgi:NAD(P)-dependent dehydrogenase (short-subunit alcohol dehydrogenase family)
VKKLEHRTLVIIGGTTGLGLSAAQACVAQGASVVVAGRNPENVTRAEAMLGTSAKGLAADASEPETAVRAIKLALSAFGGFHGLYHVAGGSGRRWGDGPLHEITDAGWAETINLNLSSLFFSNRAAIRHWIQEGRGGAILNMTSVLGFSPSPKFFSTHAYATAKAGIIGLTQSVAAFYASSNIRCNALAPALVATPMSERAQGNEAILQFIKTKQPLDGGRIGQATDLDAAAVYFLSDDSRFVTGQVLAVDGGWAVSEGQYE